MKDNPFTPEYAHKTSRSRRPPPVADAEFWGRFPASEAGKFLVKGLLFFVLFLEEQKKKINKKKISFTPTCRGNGKKEKQQTQFPQYPFPLFNYFLYLSSPLIQHNT